MNEPKTDAEKIAWYDSHHGPKGEVLCVWCKEPAHSCGHFKARERVVQLEIALKPLCDIADAYDGEGLDEARPSWKTRPVDESSVELYRGRGGKRLLTLGECIVARMVMRDRS